MKTRNRLYLLQTVVSCAALAALAAPGAAIAAGVSAGTSIQNTATATFDTGTQTVTIQSNTVTVRVDEVLDVAVAGLTPAGVAIGGSATVLAYSVTNTGNGPEAFNLVVDPAVAGNDFDMTVQSIAVDSNGNGTYDPGVDQVLAASAPTPVIPADGALTVFVLATLPASAVDGDDSQVRLTATAVTGTGAPGTAFAGQGANGSDAIVGASSATGAALDALTASLASVTLTKAATVQDPFGGSSNVPGAIVTYTISAAVAGSGQVQNLRITDPIPAGTTYQPGTLALDGGGLSDAADGDAGSAAASGIDVNLGTVNGGTTRVVLFKVKIN